MKQSHVDESSYRMKQLLHSKNCDVLIMVQDRMEHEKIIEILHFYTNLFIFFLKYVPKRKEFAKLQVFIV